MELGIRDVYCYEASSDISSYTVLVKGKRQARERGTHSHTHTHTHILEWKQNGEFVLCGLAFFKRSSVSVLKIKKNSRLRRGIREL
jgi:hypothetical protein